jgi:hypothetical protein
LNWVQTSNLLADEALIAPEGVSLENVKEALTVTSRDSVMEFGALARLSSNILPGKKEVRLHFPGLKRVRKASGWPLLFPGGQPPFDGTDTWVVCTFEVEVGTNYHNNR